MKAIYSQIKELVPKLTAKPIEVGQNMTMAGLMMDGFEEILYGGKKDYLLSFEVRQNRADCFSVIGLAREAAARYGLAIKLPKAKVFKEGKKKLLIGVNAGSADVKRILAIEINSAKNDDSPKWLKEFLEIYGMNSKNVMVDFSNYVMILTGYPSHLLDMEKVKGKICWARSGSPQKITTLDGSVVELPAGDELIIKDGQKILALAGIVGGKNAEITAKTTQLFAEMAVYNGAKIRKDSRTTKIVTEASIRLEKDLDPNGAEYAFKLLVSLILQYCGGEVQSKVFEYYSQKNLPRKIWFNLKRPADFAGVSISDKTSLNIFKNLGFSVNSAKKKGFVSVTVPTFRTDIALPEDLVEEVVRIWGYDKIPSDVHPALRIVSDITPKHITMIDAIKKMLSANGLDEILSIPLVREGENAKSNYREWNIVLTENAVNELPELRQSLAVGLIGQAQEYQKKNVEMIDIFETGKVFGKIKNVYKENESLGILSCSQGKDLGFVQKKAEIVLRSLGFGKIEYAPAKIIPAAANLHSCWNVIVEGKNCGIIYKMRREILKKDAYFAELDVDELARIKTIGVNPVVELTEKLVALDVNIELKDASRLKEYLENIKKYIGKKHFWSIAAVDCFQQEDMTKYTLRITYSGLSDTAAKKIHAEILALVSQNKEIK